MGIKVVPVSLMKFNRERGCGREGDEITRLETRELMVRDITPILSTTFANIELECKISPKGSSEFQTIL